MTDLIGHEIEHRESGEKYLIVGADAGLDEWSVQPVNFGPVTRYTARSLETTFFLPEGLSAEADVEEARHPKVPTFEELQREAHRQRRAIENEHKRQRLEQNKPSRRPPASPTQDAVSGDGWSPEEVLAGRVPKGYKSNARKIAENIADDPSAARHFRAHPEMYAPVVGSELCELLAERQGTSVSEIRREATQADARS